MCVCVRMCDVYYFYYLISEFDLFVDVQLQAVAHISQYKMLVRSIHCFQNPFLVLYQRK